MSLRRDFLTHFSKCRLRHLTRKNINLTLAIMMADDLDIAAAAPPTPSSRYRSLKTKLDFLLRELHLLHHYFATEGSTQEAQAGHGGAEPAHRLKSTSPTAHRFSNVVRKSPVYDTVSEPVRIKIEVEKV